MKIHNVGSREIISEACEYQSYQIHRFPLPLRRIWIYQSLSRKRYTSLKLLNFLVVRSVGRSVGVQVEQMVLQITDMFVLSIISFYLWKSNSWPPAS